MIHRLKQAVLAMLTLALASCASVSDMPLKSGSPNVDLSTKSILVAKIKIVNKNHPSQQPDLCCIFLKKDGKLFSFKEPEEIAHYNSDGNEYYVSMDTEPGKAEIEFARFLRSVPLVLSAMADLPFHEEIDVPEGKIVYLGNITATIVAKGDSEQPAAGSPFPLIDQAVAGFSNGIFEVKVADNYEADMKALFDRFPYLKGKETVNMVMPQWVHPEMRPKTELTTASN